MRVITGIARGRKLVTPDGLDTRPTIDRVKEGMFSAIQFDIEGRTVLDLFAGSGQLGVEALSRGAKLAVFVDTSRDSVECVRTNLKNTGLDKQSRVLNTDSFAFLCGKTEKFDIAFLDPPYHNGMIEKVMERLPECMSENGIVVCETWEDEALPEQFDRFSISKKYRYGKVNVTIYRVMQ